MIINVKHSYVPYVLHQSYTISLDIVDQILSSYIMPQQLNNDLMGILNCVDRND